MLPYILKTVVGGVMGVGGPYLGNDTVRPLYKVKWTDDEVHEVLRKVEGKDEDVIKELEKYGIKIDSNRVDIESLFKLFKNQVNHDEKITEILTTDTTNTNTNFPRPSLIIASSSFWDISNYNNAGMKSSTDQLQQIKSNWKTQFKSEILESLHGVFGDRVPVYVRTTPIPRSRRYKHEVVRGLNDAVRSLAAEDSRVAGVLDWDVWGGVKFMQDGFHADENAREKFLNKAFREVEIWNRAKDVCEGSVVAR
ncbi:hypothetical protein HDU76_008959 [Blyttiomyces sp. JEL0837]|nr:hypothetical protein HDU76_008959 [Blyttiomyces sp. JEL0837]